MNPPQYPPSDNAGHTTGTDQPDPDRPVGPIAYLTGEYPRATDTFIQREIAGLRERGVEVFACTVRRTGPEHHTSPWIKAEAAATFPVLDNASKPLRLLAAHAAAWFKTPGRYLATVKLAIRTSPPGIKGGLYQLFYFLEAGVLARHLQCRGVRHLHNHFANSSGNVALLAAQLADIPCSFSLHGPAIFFEPMYWRLDEKLRHARFVNNISHFCRSQAMVYAKPQHWAKMHIVHCGVKPDQYAPVHHQPGRKRLLFVGRLAAVKGLPMLLDAIARLRDKHPDLRLTLVGDGPDRRDLEQRANDLGLGEHVEFTGYLAPDQVASRLADTDVFVLPSFAEGVPVVLMEALAAGVPVVTTRIAGVGELVEDTVNGYTVPPGDVDSLTDRIDALLNNADLRARMGHAGRDKVRAEYDIDREVAWLHEIFTTYANDQTPPLRPPPPATESIHPTPG